MASVGVIMERSLPFTTSNTTIKTFRHALSLDEVRAPSLSQDCLSVPLMIVSISLSIA